MIRIIAFILLLPTLWALHGCAEAPEPQRVRIATFNIAMGLAHEGELAARLASGADPGLIQVAEILQRVRPDIVLLNEFDYAPEAASLLIHNYLLRPWSGQERLEYRVLFLAPVNTGQDSGLDLNGNGQLGDPEDAWGFGRFPGQYAMAVLSRFELSDTAPRTFRDFPWNAMPGALRPYRENGDSYYPEHIWDVLKLSSKSHWDLVFDIGGTELHLLASHPTPSVFDGPEDRNGRRNHDEIRLWADYVQPGAGDYLVDDAGQRGGLAGDGPFVIVGDLNADPHDGDTTDRAILQLLEHPRIDASCVPRSRGGAEAAARQAGRNLDHGGDPAADTSDFNDERVGNLRIDYVLPSVGLEILGCGVYWPAAGSAGHDLVGVSDHRLVWLDLGLPPAAP